MPVKFGRDANSGPKSQGDFQQASSFSVELDGVTVGGIVAVDGIGDENEVVPYRHGEENATRTRAGNILMKPITLTREWAANKEFMNWRQNVRDGKTDRRSVSIIFLSDDKTESMRLNLFNAWPSAWFGPELKTTSSAHAVERLVLQYEDMKFA